MVAALPMYDWPEARTQTDALWLRIRNALAAAGFNPPEKLTRETGNLHAFWRHPDLFFAQTCWGPMADGLAEQVHVIGQPDYSDVEGGEGELYRSVVLMREGDPQSPATRIADRRDLLAGKRLAYNQPDSMSGYLALRQDLGSLKLFKEQLPTGGHRASIRAVRRGKADACAIDCRSWALAQLHEPAAEGLVPVGWTSARKGLPYITGRATKPDAVATMRNALMDAGLIVA